MTICQQQSPPSEDFDRQLFLHARMYVHAVQICNLTLECAEGAMHNCQRPLVSLVGWPAEFAAASEAPAPRAWHARVRAARAVCFLMAFQDTPRPRDNNMRHQAAAAFAALFEKALA